MLGANQRCELEIKSEVLYLYLHTLSYIFITKKVHEKESAVSLTYLMHRFFILGFVPLDLIKFIVEWWRGFKRGTIARFQCNRGFLDMSNQHNCCTRI